MSDILQRVEDMLVDCAIGPMRTLKTDDLTRVLYDASEEIVHLRARETRLREALEKIVNAPYPDTRFNGRGMIPDFDGFKSIARAALGEGKK